MMFAGSSVVTLQASGAHRESINRVINLEDVGHKHGARQDCQATDDSPNGCGPGGKGCTARSDHLQSIATPCKKLGSVACVDISYAGSTPDRASYTPAKLKLHRVRNARL